MLEFIELTNVGPAPHMRLDFAPRLNILTGDNGLGKTFTLEVAWWVIAREWTQPAIPPPEGVDGARIAWMRDGGEHVHGFDAQTQRWAGPNPSLELSRRLGPVLSARCDGSYAVSDRARARGGTYSRGPAAAQRGVFVLSPQAVWRGQTEEGEAVSNGLLLDWVDWQYRKQDLFESLAEVLAVLSCSPEQPMRPGKPRRVLLGDPRDTPTVELPYGTVPVTHLSAGMKRAVEVAYLLVWAFAEHREALALRKLPGPSGGVLLLIDEVEAHLHPQWQRRLLPAVLEAVKVIQEDMQVQIIATTHEPLVLASLEPIWDEEKDALFHFRLDHERKVAVDPVPWTRRGTVSAWLRSDVFDLGEDRSPQAEQAIEDARTLLRMDAPSKEAVREVTARLQAALGDIDPFWVRWAAFAEKAGVDL